MSKDDYNKTNLKKNISHLKCKIILSKLNMEKSQ